MSPRNVIAGSVLAASLGLGAPARRSDFGIDMFAPAIGDEVDLIIEIEALRQDQQDVSGRPIPPRTSRLSPIS
jgi:hypothetical protein